jgi:hypothetical protein
LAAERKYAASGLVRLREDVIHVDSFLREAERLMPVAHGGASGRCKLFELIGRFLSMTPEVEAALAE